MKQLDILFLNRLLYLSARQLSFSLNANNGDLSHNFKTVENRKHFTANVAWNLYNVYSYIDLFLKEYEGDCVDIKIDFNNPHNQLSQDIFEQFPHYKKYISEVPETERISHDEYLKPLLNLFSIPQDMECKR